MEYTISKLLAVAQVALFFYLPSAYLRPHWTFLVDTLGGPKWANVFGVPFLHLLVLLTFNAIFYLIYKLHSHFFEKYKLSLKPWAWNSPEKATRDEFNSLFITSLFATLFNVFLTVPLGYLNYDASVKFGYSASLETFPSPLTSALRILFFMVVEDALFYTSHRILHTFPFLYKNVHKFHHKWHQSISLSAEATHPVEFVLGNVIPFAAGPLFAGAHLVDTYLWVIWRIGETVTNHSGYDFPWTLWSIFPFQGSAYAHDAHHSVNNNGNFASFFVWCDWALGTLIDEKQALKILRPKNDENPTEMGKEKGRKGEEKRNAGVVGKKGD